MKSSWNWHIDAAIEQRKGKEDSDEDPFNWESLDDLADELKEIYEKWLASDRTDKEKKRLIEMVLWLSWECQDYKDAFNSM